MELNMAVFINAINALISKALDETITTAEVNMIKAKLKMMDDTDAFDYREIAKFKKHIASFVKIIKLREINKAAETVVAVIAEPIAEPIAEAIAETITIAEPVITEQIPEVIAETIAVIAEPVTTEQIPEVIAQPIIAVTRPLTRRTLKILPKVADSIPKIIPVIESESDSDAEIIPKIDLAELKRRSGITTIRTSVLPPSEYDDDDSDEEEQTKEQEDSSDDEITMLAKTTKISMSHRDRIMKQKEIIPVSTYHNAQGFSKEVRDQMKKENTKDTDFYSKLCDNRLKAKRNGNPCMI